MDSATLLTRLDAVHAAAERRYWLTGSELCDLLELDPALLTPGGAGPAPFTWRQWRAEPTVAADGQAYWRLWPQGGPPEAGSDALPIEQSTDSAWAYANTHPNEPAPWAYYMASRHLLPPAAHQQLLSFALENESSFADGSFADEGRDISRCRINHRLDQAMPFLQQHIVRATGDLLRWLQVAPFKPHHINAHLAAYNNEDFYAPHFDNLTDSTRDRRISFVYCLNREPGAFQGGELALYNVRPEGEGLKAKRSVIVPAENNSIVFFPSNTMNAILPVLCPSGAFADSLFVVHGWICAEPEP